MKYILIAVIILFGVRYSFSQDTSAYQNESITKKIIQYQSMEKKAEIYEMQAQMQLQNVSFYKKDARVYFDSAYIVSKKAEIDKNNAQLYLIQFNFFYNLASKLASKADTAMKMAELLQDSASMKHKETDEFFLKLAEQYNQVVERNLVDSTYTVQLEAGDMLLSKFSNVKGVEVIVPSDKIKRFVVGLFKTKIEADAFRQKMVELGYSKAFVRSLDSLNF